MKPLYLIVLGAALLAVVVSVAIAWYTAWKSRKTMERLQDMLDTAANGVFSESVFDESLLSALETKMAHYLTASEVSARNLAAEKDKIKTLIADISHQTKTPIANILLYAQLLKEQELAADSAVCVEALSAQAQKLAFLIDSLVKTSRLETGVLALHPKDQAVQPLLDQVLEQFAPQAGGRNMTLTAEDTGVYACFDLKWTVEALGNIVDNALKYTPQGGTVHLRAAPYEFFARIDVTDNGIGIAEAEQPKIFSRFYRAPAVSASEGVGIGLYLTRQIIAGQGGYVKVSSKPGAGSTFSVFLPLKN